jgi:hypothetical protein
MKRTSRKPSTLSESVQRHLNAYALAASAAGVSMLALTQPAQARIVYTHANKRLPECRQDRNLCVKLDLNHDGIADFSLYYGTYRGWGLTVNEFQHSPNEVWGTGVSASALPSGVRVRADRQFGKSHFFMAKCNTSSGFSCKKGSGPWYNVKNRYLGLKFVIKGRIHYGWARLNVGTKQHPYPTLTGYAYETIPNKAIITGKTNGPDVIIVEPATLGHLARGASAVSAWRVKRTAATGH